MTSATTTRARSNALVSASVPLNAVPMAVRQAATITASVMVLLVGVVGKPARSPGQAEAALGDDVALHLARPGIDRRAEREPQHVLDATAPGRAGVEVAPQRVGADQLAEVLGH